LLRLNDAEVMLNTAYESHERPPAPDPARIASHADTALFFGCPDVNATYAHLRSKGVDAEEPKLTSYGFKALSFRDPDGYSLCFHWPAT
jgi:glyoxylase I family protein